MIIILYMLSQISDFQAVVSLHWIYCFVAFGAAQVNPPSGSVIANFEGTVNATTLICNVTDEFGNRAVTSWDLGNFRGVSRQGFTIDLAPNLFLVGGDPIPGSPEFTYENQMMILNLTSELDQVMVFCGLIFAEAEFTLRIYRKFSYVQLNLS